MTLFRGGSGPARFSHAFGDSTAQFGRPSHLITMALRITLINKLRLMARSFATANELVFRNATAKEVGVITRRAIQEGWHVGPYDFPCGFAFDPKSIFLGEVNGELATHVTVVEYPHHHYHAGGMIISKKFRNAGYAVKSVYKAMEVCDRSYTIGTDVNLDVKLEYEKLGGEVAWNTHLAMLDLERILANTATLAEQPDVSIKPICSKNLDKLLKYDQSVFGTPRQTFMTRWIGVPGSLGWAAVNEKSDKILGYAIVKQVIRDGGTEIGLAMAPLYADNAQVAKLLLKTAAEDCLANEAVPKTKLELFHPVGDNCGEGAAEMMEELEAELTHIAYRMYSKGIPPGRHMKKIYGIASPTFD